MEKRVIFDLLRNCLAAIGLVNLVFSLYRVYGVEGMSFSAQLQLGLSIIAVLIIMVWTMIARERQIKREAEVDFLRQRPEYRKYRLLWNLYGLLAQGRSYHSADGMSPERFLEWKIEVRKLLEEWGEEETRTYHLNLPPHADLKSHIDKLQEVLEDQTRPLG